MKKRKLCAFLMAIAIMIPLAGCNGGGTADSDTSDESTASQVSSEASSSSEAEEEEDSTSDTTDTSADGDTEIWDGPITDFEFMNMSNSWDPIIWGNDPVTEKMLNITGVNLNCSIPNGDWEQIANVMLAAEDYPELMHMNVNAIYNQYVVAGALRSIDDLSEEYGYPNFMNGTYIPEDVIKARLSDDGKLYILPNWFSEDGFGSVGTAVNVRTDLFEEYGPENFETMDDFYDYLVKIRDANLTTSEGVKIWPLAYSQFDDQYIGYMTNMWGSKISKYNYFNEDTNKVEVMLRSPALVQSLEFFNKCLQEGLLDPEVLSFETETVFKEHTTQGKYGAVISESWSLWDANSLLGSQDPKTIYKSVPPPQGNPGTQQYLGRIHKTGGSGFFVTKNCPEDKLEALMRFLDYRMSDEGQILNFYGVEGNTMEFENGDHTKPVLYPEAYEAKLADFDGYARSHGVRVFDMMNNANWNWERTQEAPDRQANRKIATDYAFDGTITASLIIDPLTPEGILLAELEANMRADLTKIIMEPDTSKVPQMVADLLAEYERKGVESLEAEWTKQYLAKM